MSGAAAARFQPTTHIAVFTIAGLGFAGLAPMAWFASIGGFNPLGAALMLAASASWAAGSL